MDTAKFVSNVLDFTELVYFENDFSMDLPYIVLEEVKLEKEEFEFFAMNLLEEYSWLEGKGGKFGDARRVLRIVADDLDYALLVDSEGESYPRYVARVAA